MAPDGPRLLRAWLTAQGKTMTAFAADLGLTLETLSRYLSGKMAPSRTSALAIEFLTAGAVPASSWVTR